MKNGCVYLLGGGCGTADLITWRGLRLLRACDVVLYDDLLDEALLDETKEGCEHIYVGKRCGSHAMAQEQIHALLLQKARQGRMVVRLKGGDPFVFGRGGEEALFLRRAGIAYAVIPGVSAAIAVPAAAGIPVTHRGVAQGFHVITGHTAEGALAESFEALAKLTGTLVFLMGLQHLEELAQGLCRAGKAAQTPAAVISHGCMPHQRVLRAPLGEIAAAVRTAGLQSPAVIVVGAAAGLDFSDTLAYPLAGIKIGVTGTKRMTARLSEMLGAYGAAVVQMDYLKILPNFHNPLLEDVLRHWQEYAWCVFTSPNGVELFFSYLHKRRWDLRRLAGVQFAVVGAATAAALARHGVYAAYQPERYEVDALAQGLCERVSGQERILLLRAAQGSPALPARLAAAQLRYTDVGLYATATQEEKCRRAQETAAGLDYITFASSLGVRGFLEGGGRLPAGVRAVCIGRQTAQTLAEYGYTAPLMAKRAAAEGLLAAILEEVEHEKISQTAHDRSHATAGAGDKADGRGDDLSHLRYRGGGNQKPD